MNKKDKVFIIIFLLIVVGAIIGRVVIHLDKEKQHMASLYYKQNTAFGLSGDLSKRDYYHGADELVLNEFAVNLFVYNSMNPDSQLSVDEVVEYLSEEYDSNKKPKIYSQPENISSYIAWSVHGGSDIAFEFGRSFADYLRGKGDSMFWEMSYEEVVAALEEYKNSPEYEPPQA